MVVASVEVEAGGVFRRRNSVDLVFGDLDDVGSRRRAFERIIRSGIRVKSGVNTVGHGRSNTV